MILYEISFLELDLQLRLQPMLLSFKTDLTVITMIIIKWELISSLRLIPAEIFFLVFFFTTAFSFFFVILKMSWLGMHGNSNAMCFRIGLLGTLFPLKIQRKIKFPNNFHDVCWNWIANISRTSLKDGNKNENVQRGTQYETMIKRNTRF